MLRELVMSTRAPRYFVDKVSFKTTASKSQLESLKDKHKGKPMLVVGNGPSLNKTPLNDFQHVPSIGMNKIDLLFSRVTWRPDLILCVNNLVVKQHREQFVESDIPVFVSWKARWFLPQHAKNVSYFLNDLGDDFSEDIVERVGSGGTVTYAALQFAYYMGANPVILFGVDHSFKAEGKQNAIAKREGDDVNHFDPNYFKAGSFWGLPNLDLSELAYQKSRDAFEADGREVLDATIEGQLDIFKKIDLDTARRLTA